LGFLKIFDRDKQLIEQIPEILPTNSKEELNKLFLNWFNSLGNLKKKKENENINNTVFNDNFNFSRGLKLSHKIYC